MGCGMNPRTWMDFWACSLSDHYDRWSEHSFVLVVTQKFILLAERGVARGSESFADSRCEPVLVCVSLAKPSLVLAKRASPDETLFQL
ncbi:hypothetical protein QL285_071033 [Trifolium repens]|nr:hypothetical protein QL285_071033 [Trifolium repens]